MIEQFQIFLLMTAVICSLALIGIAIGRRLIDKFTRHQLAVDATIEDMKNYRPGDTYISEQYIEKTILDNMHSTPKNEVDQDIVFAYRRHRGMK